MKKVERHIKRDFLKRKLYTLTEIKKVLLKSIIQNYCLSDSEKCYAVYQLSQFRTYSSISKQNNNICIKTGRYKGILKHTNMSRHFIKKLVAKNELQNFRINSW